MKGKLLVLSLLLILMIMPAALFAGGQEEGATDKEVTLEFWHLWGGSRTELIEDLITDFQTTHPNVKFDVTFVPPNELQTKIVQAAGTGTLPDVFSMHSGWYVNLLPEETLMNLDSKLSAEGIDINDILVEAEAARSYWDGSVYSLPNVNAGAQGLFFYNKDMMREAGLDPADTPENWDEFVALSKKLVQGLNGPDQLDYIAWDPNQMAGQPAMVVFSYGAGHPTVSEDGKKSLFTTPGVLETAHAFDDYVEEVYGPWGGYQALAEWNSRVVGVDTGGAATQGFVQGKQGFYVSGSWTIAQVKSADPDMDFSIMPVPGFNGLHGGTALNGWSYAINKKTKNGAAAFEFLKFITIDPEGNGEFCIAQGRPSPISSVNEDPRLKEIGPLWDQLVYSMNRDIVPPTDIFQDTVKPWLRDFPALRMNGMSVEEAMKVIDEKFQDYLNDLNS